MFSHLTPYAGDPILSLVEAFSQDPRSDKTNLAIGVYCDENGRLVLPEAVRRAATLPTLPPCPLSAPPRCISAWKAKCGSAKKKCMTTSPLAA